MKRNEMFQWARLFIVTFFISFISIIIGVAFIVLFNLYQEFGVRAFSGRTMFSILNIWAHKYLLRNALVSIFLAVLVATKYISIRGSGDKQ